jgi:hypothetical protein
MLDPRIGNTGLQSGGEVLDDDNRFGTRVLELEFEFAGGVKGVNVNNHHACTHQCSDCHRVLRRIGHHQRHAVTLDQPQTLKVSRQGNRCVVDGLIADCLTQKTHAGAITVFLEIAVKQIDQ